MPYSRPLAGPVTPDPATPGLRKGSTQFPVHVGAEARSESGNEPPRDTPACVSPRSRAASNPVVLRSNGQPIKSSIKSSTNSPHPLSPRLRSRSEPTAVSGSPKEVRFASAEEGLESVTVFERRAPPDTVSLPLTEQRQATGIKRTPQNPPPESQDGKWSYALLVQDPNVPHTPDAGSMVALEAMWLAGPDAVSPKGTPPT
ncbi:hypothetical protein DFH06DRAFT_1349624 [Mycena polygramma]|nr:hypothetical protein DFH06DRAFT_1349622 [Mycena polygramma]KAJ7604190.1 hypothetical protein DFH06DRAFT_1349624 [Mycena polygramma]